MPKTTKEKIQILKDICNHLEDLASDEDLCNDEYALLEEITHLEEHDWDSNILAHFIDGMQLGIKETESDLISLKKELSKTQSVVQELKDEIVRIITDREIMRTRHFKHIDCQKETIEKLQKENEELKISNNQMKSSAIMKENAELHNIISQKDREWEEKIKDKLKEIRPVSHNTYMLCWEQLEKKLLKELNIKED